MQGTNAISSPPQLRALIGIVTVAAVCTGEISYADSSHEHTRCWGPCPSGFRWAFLPTYNTFRFAFLQPPEIATQWQATDCDPTLCGVGMVAIVAMPLADTFSCY